MNTETEKTGFSWIPAIPPPAALLVALLFNLRFFYQALNQVWQTPTSWRNAQELLNSETLTLSSLPIAELAFLAKDLTLSLLAAEAQTLLKINHYFSDSMGILVLTLLNLEVIYMFLTMQYHRKKNAESEAKGKAAGRAEGRAEVEAETREWFAQAQAQYPELKPPPFLNGRPNGS